MLIYDHSQQTVDITFR